MTFFNDVDSRRRGRSTRFGRVGIVVSACLLAAVTVGPTWAAPVPVGSVAIYSGPGISEPIGITVGPDGALWFTNSGNNSIGRIDITSHSVNNYTGAGCSSSECISHPVGIAAGPDNALWFTNYITASLNESIGRIDTSGSITTYKNSDNIGPNCSGPDCIAGPAEIVLGTDGALWFANAGNHTPGSIGRIDPFSHAVSHYTDPSIHYPIGIAVGPDGAIWFTNYFVGTIGRIDPISHIVSNYVDPTISIPTQITAGPDGGLWFTNQSNNSIGRIDAISHLISSYTDPTISSPRGITRGPDNAIWFTNFLNNSIGRIDPVSHIISNYTGTGINLPNRIVGGPDGAIWFTNLGNDSIGRLQAVADLDEDGVADDTDNCPALANPGQENADGDAFGDECDPTPNGTDADGDGIPDSTDVCPGTAGGESVDANGCSADQRDTDGDGVSNAADLCPGTLSGQSVDASGCSASQYDTDNDGVNDAVDNCPVTANPGQEDTDHDGLGDICDYALRVGGAFVVGDGSATGTVMFWGAQWSKKNTLSGGSAPPAFKGFAKFPATPACGSTWSTDPGNSSPPPAGPIPPYITVVVTSSTTKAGSTISGNVVRVVVVKTNPGYDSNPGHAGTGTVVATLCTS
jgi:virginiamycin B lyase